MTDPVAIARGWIGTPYLHQAATRGAGCDCLGLIRGIRREMGVPETDAIPAYSPDWSEPQGEERLWQAARLHLHARPLSHPRPGDVILFRMRPGAVAKHLGIQTATGAEAAFVHAMSGPGVVESPLSAPWARRIVARFAFFPED